MIFIAHRGNTNGSNYQEENKENHLLKAIEQGYFVETDLWVVDDLLYLGHDEPQYNIDSTFIEEITSKLFCHCKNIDALNYMLYNHHNVECFFHESDACVLTSKNRIWTYPGNILRPQSICVMPEYSKTKYKDFSHCYGVCSDYISELNALH